MPSILESRTRFLTREDYLRVLSAENRATGLRTIYEKEFAPRLVKLVEERPTDLSVLLTELDKYHTKILTEIVIEDPNNVVLRGVDALVRLYSLTPALFAHQKGLRPRTFVSVPVVDPLELITQPRIAYYVNPLISNTLRDYLSTGRLKPESVARAFDRILSAIRGSGSYHEFLVSSMLYDMIMIRLCSIREFQETPFRPALITAQELKGVCELATVDLQSAFNALKKSHPCMNTAVSVFEDSTRLVQPPESLDLTIAVSTAYVASQILHQSGRSFNVKKYLFYLRQSMLFRTVLVLLEELTLKPDLRLFVERWVKP